MTQGQRRLPFARTYLVCIASDKVRRTVRMVLHGMLYDRLSLEAQLSFFTRQRPLVFPTLISLT